MTIHTNLLTSKSLTNHALGSFGRAGDGLVSLYLHRSGGRVSIGGGIYGSQWIDSFEVDANLQSFIEEFIWRLDVILDLDFRLVSDRASSNLDFYIDTEIDIGSSGQILGLAIPNTTRSRSWWEILVNGPAILADSDYLRFAIVHEIGHALGLEHPFDASDADVTGAVYGDPDASITVMSYTRPSGGWPVWYQPADLTALVSVWGLEDDKGSQLWQLKAPDGSLLTLETQAALQNLALADGHQLLGAAAGYWSPNAPPFAQGDHFHLGEDSDLSIGLADLLLNDGDADGDALEVISVAGVEVGAIPATLGLEGGTLLIDRVTGIQFTPHPNWHGSLNILYLVSDGLGSSEARITFEVVAKNDAPSFTGLFPSLNVIRSQPFEHRLPLELAQDVDGDSLSFSLQASGVSGFQPLLHRLPDWLAFDADRGVLLGLVPRNLPDSELRLTITATDPHGLSAASDLRLIVEQPPLPDPPVPAELTSPPQPGAPDRTVVTSPPPDNSIALPDAADPGSPAVTSPARPASARLLEPGHGTVTSGTIGFGSDRPSSLVALASPDDLNLPSVLVGGARQDQYVIASGGFTVIADAPTPGLVARSRGSVRGSRDQVTGFVGSPAEWSVQHLGAYDLLITSSSALGEGGADSPTTVLLADPFGYMHKSHKLETLVFSRDGQRNRSISLQRALRAFARGPEIDYGDLPSPIRDGLGEVLGQPWSADSLHSVISALHPEAILFS